MLSDYGLESIRTYSTPMIASFYEEFFGHEGQPIEGKEDYESMIGALIYLSSRTRPDIATAVGILSTYQAKTTKFLHTQLKRVFGYLRGTAEIGIQFGRVSDIHLKFFTDSDFAGAKSDRRSRTGWIGLLNGSAVTWASHKQTCNALSMTEAEFIALSECCEEVKWIRLFLAEI